MKTSSIPSPGEARALMTGGGACEDEILRDGCARMAEVARKMTPEQRKRAPASFTQACKDADDRDRLNGVYMSTPPL